MKKRRKNFTSFIFDYNQYGGMAGGYIGEEGGAIWGLKLGVYVFIGVFFKKRRG